jgi:hypothetical protein
MDYSSPMDNRQKIASMIKVEQLDLFRKKLQYSHKRTSELFDKYHVWEFIDDAFEGLHVQGPVSTFEDIRGYIKNSAGTYARK